MAEIEYTVKLTSSEYKLLEESAAKLKMTPGQVLDQAIADIAKKASNPPRTLADVAKEAAEEERLDG